MAKQKSNNYVYQRERDIQNIPYLRREGQKINKQLGGGEPIKGSLVVLDSGLEVLITSENFNGGIVPLNWTNDITLPWSVDNDGLGGESGYYYKSPKILTINTTSTVTFTKDFGITPKLYSIKFKLYQDTELCCDYLKFTANGITTQFSEFTSAGWEIVEVFSTLSGIQTLDFTFTTDGSAFTGESEVAFTDLEINSLDSVYIEPLITIEDLTAKKAFFLDTYSKVLSTDFQMSVITRENNPIRVGSDYLGNETCTVVSIYGLDSNSVSGNFNTCIGWKALQNNTLGVANTGVGADSIRNVTIGNNNIGIGKTVGDTLITGSDNILIGAGSNVNSAAAINRIVIGKGAIGTKNNQVILGNSAITEVLTYGDVEISQAATAQGIIMKDATLGTRHRITLDNGALVVGAAL